MDALPRNSHSLQTGYAYHNGLRVDWHRPDRHLPPPEAQLLARKAQAKLVRGVVGSGKTLILLNRAKFISEQNAN